MHIYICKYTCTGSWSGWKQQWKPSSSNFNLLRQWRLLENSCTLLKIFFFLLQWPKFPHQNCKKARTHQQTHPGKEKQPFLLWFAKIDTIRLSSASCHGRVPLMAFFPLKFWRESCTSHWNEQRANLFWEPVTNIKATPKHKESPVRLEYDAEFTQKTLLICIWYSIKCLEK